MSREEIKVLIFSINNEYYAADIMEVERILGYTELTELPDSPNFVEGVMNYEKRILPVISLAKKFNIPCSKISDEAKIIVVKGSEGKIGIIVDVVSEVKDIKKESIEDAPEITASITRKYINGLIKLNDRIIIFLDLSSILTDKEKKELIQ